MAEDNQLEPIYQIRREARGEGSRAEAGYWKRRLILGGVGLFCIAALISGVFLWRAFTYVKTVRAKVCAAGVAVPSGLNARLVELYVVPDDHVKKGQLLARLDDSELQAALTAAEAARAVKESLHAQVKARVSANVEAAGAGVGVAEARVESAQAALDLRKARLSEQIRGAQAEYEGARARLERLLKGPRSEDIETARVRLSSAKAVEALYALEVAQSEQLVGEGIDSQHILEVKKTQLVTQKNQVRTAELALARLLAGATEEEAEAARQVVAAREADLALARAGQKEVEALVAQLAIRQAERRQAEAELARAEALRAEVAVAEREVEAAQAEVGKAKAALARASILSPAEGTVIRTFYRVGEFCREGVEVILVTDESKGIWVEGFVREKDGAHVKAGQSAQIKVFAVSWWDVDATVEAVGSATSSVDRPSPAPASGSSQLQMPELVWVKLRAVKEHQGWRPGNSARAIIRVR